MMWSCPACLRLRWPLGSNDTGPALGLHANQGPGRRDETLGSVPFPNSAYGPMNHWADVAFTPPGAVARRLSAASSPFEREQPDCCPFIGWLVSVSRWVRASGPGYQSSARQAFHLGGEFVLDLWDALHCCPQARRRVLAGHCG